MKLLISSLAYRRRTVSVSGPGAAPPPGAAHHLAGHLGGQRPTASPGAAAHRHDRAGRTGALVRRWSTGSQGTADFHRPPSPGPAVPQERRPPETPRLTSTSSRTIKGSIEHDPVWLPPLPLNLARGSSRTAT